MPLPWQHTLLARNRRHSGLRAVAWGGWESAAGERVAECGGRRWDAAPTERACPQLPRTHTRAVRHSLCQALGRAGGRGRGRQRHAGAQAGRVGREQVVGGQVGAGGGRGGCGGWRGAGRERGGERDSWQVHVCSGVGRNSGRQAQSFCSRAQPAPRRAPRTHRGRRAWARRRAGRGRGWRGRWGWGWRARRRRAGCTPAAGRASRWGRWRAARRGSACWGWG